MELHENTTDPGGLQGLTGMMATTASLQPQNSGGSDSNLALFNFLVNVVIDGLLCLFGYFGNIMTVIVLQKDGVRTSNSVLLQALAVVDSCFLTYVVLYVVLRSVYPYTGAFGAINDVKDYFVAFVLPFGWTSQTATIWMVMALAVDRYLVVAHPLKSNQWCTPKKARWVSMGVILASVLFNSVRWPRYYFVAFKSGTSSNSTFVSHLSADIQGWSEDTYRNVYHISLTFIFLFIIPLTVISVVNAWLIKALRIATKNRQKMTNQQATAKDGASKAKDKASSNVTMMMVIMITIFVICQLPDFIAGIIGAGNFKIDDTVYSYYAGIKEVLLVFNSACNFYLYCLFYNRFRQTLGKMFGCTSNETTNKYTSRSTGVSTVSTTVTKPVANVVAAKVMAEKTTESVKVNGGSPKPDHIKEDQNPEPTSDSTVHPDDVDVNLKNV